MEDVFIGDPSGILRTVIIGVLGYIGVIVMLRVSGKRTLSKMNMFDFIVTVAFGSMLATLLLSKQTALAQGLVGIGTLILLQLIVTLLSVKSKRFASLIKADPEVVYWRGRYCEQTMARVRVSKEELKAAVREAGKSSLSEVAALVLETDGTISVVEDPVRGHDALPELPPEIVKG
jgi:uncharacterized membrane protein YcaP (DUF421 family)